MSMTYLYGKKNQENWNNCIYQKYTKNWEKEIFLFCCNNKRKDEHKE